jgi:hypothetical protein
VAGCRDNPSSIDCPGAKDAMEGDDAIKPCPDVNIPPEHGFDEGWCTAHIIQRQRWQKTVGDRFKFDLELFDGKGRSFYHERYMEVDAEGRLSIQSALPYTVEIMTTIEDNDFVSFCYAGQCWSCDNNDGGVHKW